MDKSKKKIRRADIDRMIKENKEKHELKATIQKLQGKIDQQHADKAKADQMEAQCEIQQQRIEELERTAADYEKREQAASECLAFERQLNMERRINYDHETRELKQELERRNLIIDKLIGFDQ